MKVGLVLSGGFAKGAYQIGALNALKKFIPLEDIKYMSCSSIGAINGYAYLTDRLSYAEEVWKNMCGDKKKFFITKVLRDGVLDKYIDELDPMNTPLNKSFYCALLDLKERNVVYKDLSTVNRDYISKYLKASISIPPYNKSVAISGASYIDGAFVDNIPVIPLKHHDLDYIICVYFDDTCYKFENSAFDKKIIKITFPATSMISHSFIITRDSILEMIKTGYDVAMERLGIAFSQGYDNLNKVYEGINLINQTSNVESLRLTTDVVITNVNKLAKLFTKTEDRKEKTEM